MAVHTRGVCFATNDEDMRLTRADGRLRFRRDGSEYSDCRKRIDPGDDYNRFPLEVSDPVENHL